MIFDSFPLGPFVISIGGVFVLTGFFVASFFLIFTAFQKKLSVDFLSENFLIFAASALVAARIGAVIKVHFSLLLQNADANFFVKILEFVKYFFSIWRGALDPFWCLAGGLAAFFALAILHKQPILKWLDVFALPVVLFLVFVQFGGFFSAWQYGKPVSENFPIAISYDMQNVRFSGMIHPVQIYSAIVFLGIFLFGLRTWKAHCIKRKSAWENGGFFGLIFFMVMVANGILEFFRGNAVTIILENLRLPQVSSFALAILALFFLAFKTHEKHKVTKHF